jgi:hypothetical protein
MYYFASNFKDLKQKENIKLNQKKKRSCQQRHI